MSAAVHCETTKNCWRVRSGRKKGTCTAPSPWNVFKKKFHTNDAAAWRRFKEANDLMTKDKANKWACREVVKAGQHFAPFFEQLPDINLPICTEFDPSDILSSISVQSFQLNKSILQRLLSACKKNLKVASFEQQRALGVRFQVALVKTTRKMLSVVFVDKDQTHEAKKKTLIIICINAEHLPNEDKITFEQSADFVYRDMHREFEKLFITDSMTALVLVMCGYIIGNISSVQPSITKEKLLNACLCYVGICPTENNFEIKHLSDIPKTPRASKSTKKKNTPVKTVVSRRHRYNDSYQVPAGTVAPQ